MTLLLVLALLVLLVVAELAHLVRTDELGHRPPPTSLHDSGLPDRPYALR